MKFCLSNNRGEKVNSINHTDRISQDFKNNFLTFSSNKLNKQKVNQIGGKFSEKRRQKQLTNTFFKRKNKRTQNMLQY